MPSNWPSLPYDAWRATCDTLHAHTQVLGKLAATLAPPEPQLQHAALRLTARGWETYPLPAPDGSGAFVVALDLHRHEAIAEHSDGRARRLERTRDRAVGDVTRVVLAAVGELVGPVTIDPTPQEVEWRAPHDENTEHATYDPDQVAVYFAEATRAALVLAAARAPYRGRSTPANAWWGSFDLAVNVFSGRPADPPADDFIMRNAMDAQEIALGWWPGHSSYPRAAFYAYAHPAPDGFETATLSPPPPAGRRSSASTSSTGTTSCRRPTRSRPRSRSPGRRSTTGARCASGIRRSPAVSPALRLCIRRPYVLGVPAGLRWRAGTLKPREISPGCRLG